MKKFIKLTTIDNEKIGLCIDDITFLEENYADTKKAIFGFTEVRTLTTDIYVNETVEQIVDSINKIKG